MAILDVDPGCLGNQRSGTVFFASIAGGFFWVLKMTRLLRGWVVLSDEQMSKRWPFPLLNDEQMSNWVGVEHLPGGQDCSSMVILDMIMDFCYEPTSTT